jgi:hypothetical protein
VGVLGKANNRDVPLIVMCGEINHRENERSGDMTTKRLKAATPIWPKSQLLRHGPELPLSERVRRYQHNIKAIRAAGCKVPSSAMPDTLDAQIIANWFMTGAETSRRLKALIKSLAKLDDGTEIPVVLP